MLSLSTSSHIASMQHSIQSSGLSGLTSSVTRPGESKANIARQNDVQVRTDIGEPFLNSSDETHEDELMMSPSAPSIWHQIQSQPAHSTTHVAQNNASSVEPMWHPSQLQPVASWSSSYNLAEDTRMRAPAFDLESSKVVCNSGANRDSGQKRIHVAYNDPFSGGSSTHIDVGIDNWATPQRVCMKESLSIGGAMQQPANVVLPAPEAAKQQIVFEDQQQSFNDPRHQAILQDAHGSIVPMETIPQGPFSESTEVCSVVRHLCIFSRNLSTPGMKAHMSMLTVHRFIYQCHAGLLEDALASTLLMKTPTQAILGESIGDVYILASFSSTSSMESSH